MLELNKIYNEDCIETMQRIDDESINCVITSPPYWGLRDYGVNGQLGLEKTPEEYVNKLVEIFKEVKRVLKKDGMVWLNLGDSYLGGGRAGNQEKYKHNHCNFGKVRDMSIYTNPSKIPGNMKAKDMVGIPWMVAFALRNDGWYLRQDIIWHKPNPMPESVTDRCTKAHEYVFLLTKSAKYWYDADAIREEHLKTGHMDYSKRYVHKNPKDRQNGQGHGFKECYVNPNGRNKRSVWTVTTQPYPEAHFATFPEALIEPMILAGCPEWVCIKCGKARERIVEKSGGTTGRSWTDHKADLQKGMSQYDPSNHKGGLGREDAKQGNSYTVETIGWTDCGCNVGFEPGIIYDPFMGAGTTAKVALRANRRFSGSELSLEYCDIAKIRIEPLLNQKDMFYEIA